MPITVPETHKDLLEGSLRIVLSTVMPDGYPQTTPVWCNREGDRILINTMKRFRKQKNMQENPKVTLLSYDRDRPLRNIEVRGRVVEMTEERAEEHLDELTMIYAGKPHFFGDILDPEDRDNNVPVKVKIEPIRVRVEA